MNAARLRVLFVGAFPLPGREVFGGMVTSCRALLASSLPARLDLDLLDSTQISHPPPMLAVRLLRAAARCARFVGRFERRRPAAVLLFVADGASIVEKGTMAWYARLRGVPAIMFPRAGSVVNACRESAFTRAWVRIAFRGAAKIVCQSASWRDFAVGQLGFASSDVAVIRNWTASPELLAIGAARVPRHRVTVQLLFIGWVEPEKGIFELIEACRQLAIERQFTVSVVGEGTALAEARERVARYDLARRVQFRGWLSHQDLRRTLEDADAFVLPSWAEGLPNAMIEAMAAGLPVIVSSVGAIPEVIANRRSGMLVEPRDVASLVRALREVIDGAELRDNLAREAFRIVSRDFGVEGAVTRLIEEVRAAVTPAAARAEPR